MRLALDQRPRRLDLAETGLRIKLTALPRAVVKAMHPGGMWHLWPFPASMACFIDSSPDCAPDLHARISCVTLPSHSMALRSFEPAGRATQARLLRGWIVLVDSQQRAWRNAITVAVLCTRENVCCGARQARPCRLTRLSCLRDKRGGKLAAGLCKRPASGVRNHAAPACG